MDIRSFVAPSRTLGLFALVSSIGLATTVNLTGCAPSRASRDSSSTAVRSAVSGVNPLTVTVKSPTHLASVNSLLVVEPSVSERARTADITPQRLRTLIEDSAGRELGLKVFGSEWLKHAPGDLKATSGFPSAAQRSALARLGVDGVLGTELLTYDDRQGSAVGGEPATVAFRMYVVRSSDGEQIWEGTYFYRQEALSDNLFKIGEKIAPGGAAGWTPGPIALEKGISTAIQDFGRRREQQFLAK